MVYNEEGVDYPETDLPFTLDYDTFSSVLCNENGRDRIISYEGFETLFCGFSFQVIKFLNRNLGQNEHLNYNEQKFALAHIQILAPQLAQMLYPRFVDDYQRFKRLEQAPFHDYSCHLSIKLFIGLATEYMGGIADAVFTLTKGNPEFASTINFNVMHRIAELLTKKVLPIFQEGVYRNSLMYDYNKNLDDLTKLTKSLLTGLVVDTRIQSKTTSGKLKVSSDYKIKAKEDIISIVNLGLDVDGIQVEADHIKQQFDIYIPKNPRLLKVVYEDHKLMKESNAYRCNCSWEDYEKKVSYVEQENFADNDMKNIMANRIKNSIESRSICNKRFSNKVKKQFITVLKKAFESSISISHSCYKVVLHFGSKKETILSSSCNS